MHGAARLTPFTWHGLLLASTKDGRSVGSTIPSESFSVRKVGSQPGVGQPANLADALALEIGGKIRKRIRARVVVVLVLAHEGADGKHGLRADQVNERWSDVEGSDLGMLIGGANQIAVGAQTSVVHHQAVPCRGILRVEGIRGLEPRTRIAQVQLEGVCVGKFIVHAVEKVLFVPFIVHDRLFRRIEEAAGL